MKHPSSSEVDRSNVHKAYSSASSMALHKTASYCTQCRIHNGVKASNPAAMVLWAFLKLPSKRGLTSRKIIGFLKKHYTVAKEPKRTGKSLGAVLRYAVDYGLLSKRGNKYFIRQEVQD